MSEEERYYTVIQEIKEIYLSLTQGEPSPDEEIEARVSLIEKIQNLLDLGSSQVITNIDLFNIMDKLHEKQQVFKATGGTHAVGIFNANGEIIACPIAVDVEWSKLGNIMNYTNFKNLKLVRLQEPCLTCDFLNFCGGRCLYANREKLWGEARYKTICDTTIYMIKQLLLIK